MDLHLQWFAIRVRPRTEQVVAQALRGKGFEEFLPLFREQRRWSDRLKVVERPLFPGYVFARFDVQRRLPVLTIPGVVQIVGQGKVPLPLESGEIEALQIVVASRLAVEPLPYFAVGQRVRIVRGPLTGAEGTLTAVRGDSRLVASIALLQRSVAVDIDQSWAVPLSSPDVRLIA